VWAILNSSLKAVYKAFVTEWMAIEHAAQAALSALSSPR
jgi:hypothetical protein